MTLPPPIRGACWPDRIPGYDPPCGFCAVYTHHLKSAPNGSQGMTRGANFVKNKLRQEHRTIGLMLSDSLIAQLGSTAFPLGFTLRLVRVAAKMLDDDNVVTSFKSIRDGIAEAFGFDDGSGVCNWKYDQAKGKESLVRAELYCTSCWLFSEYGLKVKSLQVHGKRPIYYGPHWDKA